MVKLEKQSTMVINVNQQNKQICVHVSKQKTVGEKAKLKNLNKLLP